MNPQQAKRFFATIPKTQILASWSSTVDLIEKLNQLSPQKIDISRISTKKEIKQASELLELLLALNEQLPNDLFFDMVKLPDGQLAVVFLNEAQETQLIYREDLGNTLPILYDRNERAYKAEFDELLEKYQKQIQEKDYTKALKNISEAYHLVAEMNMDFGVNPEKFNRKQICLDWAFCYEQLGKYAQAEEMKKMSKLH